MYHNWGLEGLECLHNNLLSKMKTMKECEMQQDTMSLFETQTNGKRK